MEKWQGRAYIRKVGKGNSHILELNLAKADHFIKTHGSRALLSFKGGGPYHRALQRRKDGYALIVLSKEVLEQIGGLAGDLIEFTIQPDRSEYGMPFPEEFRETLALDPEAEEAFKALPIGRKRGVLHYIHSGKSVETRIKRALEISEKMKNKGLYGQ